MKGAFVNESQEMNANLLKGIINQIKALKTSFKGMSISCVDKTYEQQNISSSSPSCSSSKVDNNTVTTIQRIVDESCQEFISVKTRSNIQTRNCYSRPTPLDLKYEERSRFEVSSFVGTTICDWNVDGKSEREILSTLQEMVMALAAQKAKDMKGDHIATTISYGLTGQFKSWWDNFITMQQKLDILNHSYKSKKEEDMTDIIIEDGHDLLSFFLKIILLVALQSIMLLQKSILLKLCCPCLADYHWRKDVDALLSPKD